MKWVCLSLLIFSGCASGPAVIASSDGKTLVAEGAGSTRSVAKRKALGELALQLSSDVQSSCEDRTTLQQSDGDERLSRQSQCDVRVESSDDGRWGNWSSLVRCSGEQEGKKHRMTCRLERAKLQRYLRQRLARPWAKYESVQEGLAGGPKAGQEGAWIIGYHLAADLRDELAPLLDGLNALSQGGGREVARMAQDQKDLELAADPLRAAKRLRISLAGSASDVNALKPSLEKTLGRLGIRHDLDGSCAGAGTDTLHSHLRLEPTCQANPMGHSVCKLQVVFVTEHCNGGSRREGQWRAEVEGRDYQGDEQAARGKLSAQLHKLKLRDLLREACREELPIP